VSGKVGIMVKVFLKNSGYFLKEVFSIIRLNPVSNILSLFSTSLVLLILAMAVSGWWVSRNTIDAIQDEAEINVYFNAEGEESNPELLVRRIKEIGGVRDARLVDEKEAYERMAEILGKEARVLEVLDDNPFNPFIEVNINIESIDSIMDKLKFMSGVEYIRDNREVLERLVHISGILNYLGLILVISSGICTLVIISHIIRLGIHNKREEINTLRLLGAPEFFIGLPFILEGLILTIGGGILAAVLSTSAIHLFYRQVAGPLPFIPLPPGDELISGIWLLLLLSGAFLGVSGSVFGLISGKKE
jgi:cell division transport system permease protein